MKHITLTKTKNKTYFTKFYTGYTVMVLFYDIILNRNLFQNDLDQKDLRNKTPLELAVFLDHYECAKLLVEHGADCSLITKLGWNLVQEAVSTGDSNLIKLILTYRDYQRYNARLSGIPEMLNKLKQAPDFYVEMKWQFTSWIPLISKACPSDVYKIYKSGSNVRIDTTLIGFNGTSWERGNRSYIFQASEDGSATIIEIDHIKQTYHLDKLTTVDSNDDSDLYEPDDYVIQNKLTSPNIVTYLDIEKIEFERNRSGIFGWRSDKNEIINGYDCKVYTANNLQLITKTRVEHLTNERAQAFLRELDDAEDLQASKSANSSLPGFITNFFQGNEHHIKIEKSNKKLTALEYFQKQVPVDYYLNGTARRIDETQKIQTFVANLSLCDTFPLSLHDQVLPIVDLMALNNSHFKKLKEFITLQLPSGFPIKIEIPLYRVITAKVTFGNIHATETPVDYVTTINESSIVDESVFKVPAQYKCTNNYLPANVDSNLIDRRANQASNYSDYPNRFNYASQLDEDDIQIQLAIQQSIAIMHGKQEETPNGSATQSLDEYHKRQSDRLINQTEDDLILQRFIYYL